ncbi:hypothetical protein [Acidocella sp. MX-AZ02]|uniref:hypothetical protein n=1 Tax=Acidocella sp. MX-AZ02 TaxID=1214225 RepID=UPI00028CEE99|nr:hypothetical protein [Acidocella sp. MX-AZ02]EKN00832.1 hypothetical protein MXAZACID_03449 [Acidocella sp. MX-AZ02]
MPQFDVQGALAAGYSPSQLVDYLTTQHASNFDFAGARQAGYSDDQILQEYQQGSPVSTSPVTALRNSAGSVNPLTGTTGSGVKWSLN